MDYCSTCRRHLNGALVCPGCGAYAPDIAPSVIGGRTVPGPASSEEARPVGTPPAAAPDDVPHTVAAGTGRAARRRQLARWKKTQRRALVATAVALVGGGLTLASMDRSGGDRAQAATAPDLRGMGGGKAPADQYGDLDVPTPSPERTERSGKGEDERERTDEATREPTAPARTHTDSAASPRTVAPSQPRTAVPDTGARAEADVDTGAGSASGSVSGSASGSDSRDDGSDTATRPTTPPPADDSDDGNGGDSGGGTEQGTPSAPSTTSPDSSRLCLLVICLG